MEIYLTFLPSVNLQSGLNMNFVDLSRRTLNLGDDTNTFSGQVLHFRIARKRLI